MRSVEEMSKRQLLLRQAGYQSRDAVRMFHAAQFILGVAGLLLGVVYTNFIAVGLPHRLGSPKSISNDRVW